jgi:hypothetical protein
MYSEREHIEKTIVNTGLSHALDIRIGLLEEFILQLQPLGRGCPRY